MVPTGIGSTPESQGQKSSLRACDIFYICAFTWQSIWSDLQLLCTAIIPSTGFNFYFPLLVSPHFWMHEKKVN